MPCEPNIREPVLQRSAHVKPHGGKQMIDTPRFKSRWKKTRGNKKKKDGQGAECVSKHDGCIRRETTGVGCPSSITVLTQRSTLQNILSLGF